ncbi:MAG: hypothetical protein SFV53_01850 [Rickettsiales bacterium]|nr:hypothetical protein [Rickettsiales bacterium]
MKKNLISLAFLFFLFINLSTAFAANNLAILSWQEDVNLLSTGRTSEIFIQGKVINLLPNQFMTSFRISLDPKISAQISQVSFEDTILLTPILEKSNKMKNIHNFRFTLKLVSLFIILLNMTSVTLTNFPT